MRQLALSVGFVAFLAVAGCGSDEPPWQGEAAEDARELPLLYQPEVVRMSREEFAAQAAENANEISDAYLQYFRDTYGRLGFFDPSIDLRPVFAGSSSDWVGATYSPSSKVITLVGDASHDTFVHEFVHALQDQHFDLIDYDSYETSDAFLARRAIVEGDATLAQYRFFGLYNYGIDLDEVDWAGVFESRRGYSSDTLEFAEYPVIFLDYASFVYTFGLEYSAYNLARVTYEDPVAELAPHNWGLQDELFTIRPIDTTQQILQRVLVSDDADPVVEVGLAVVPPELQPRLELVDWDRFGEWYSYLLFYPLDDPGQGVDARAVAAAWDGDRALFVRDTDTQQVSVVWASAWDDEESAAAVEAMLWALHGGTPVDGQPDQAGLAADGELLWIERRETQVVLVKNLSTELVADMVEAAFTTSSNGPRRRMPSLAQAINRVQRSMGHRRCLDTSTVIQHP